MTTSAALPICLAGHVDHGKSTLVGRLMHELDLLPEGKVAALEAASSQRGVPIEWSFVLDAFQLERDQAITIDTTRVRVRTPRREFLVIDAPGHRELIRNLVTGAADTRAALLVIDAQTGAQAQTRRHLTLLRLLGVRNVVVAVNKMDLADWKEHRFTVVRDAIEAVMAKLGLVPHAVIPVSAREGANLTALSGAMPWWPGPTLVDALDALPVAAAYGQADTPLRLSVQDVYRFDGRRIVAGRLDAGTLASGDTVLMLPSGRTVRIASIDAWPQARGRATAGDNVSLLFDDPIVIERGEMLCDPNAPPKLTAVFDADLFWLGNEPLTAGRRLAVRIGCRVAPARITAVHHGWDTESLTQVKRGEVDEGNVARVTIRCDLPVAVDDVATLRSTGRFVLADDGVIVGGGIVDASGYPDQRRSRGTGGDHIVAVRHEVLARERAVRAGHVGCVVWLTGLSGAGKSTLAMALERRLFDLGWLVYTLDGDNVRRGVNADLGFSPEDRQENIRRIGEVAALFADAGVVCIAAFISPYRDDRLRARAAADEHPFIEVYVQADLQTCEARDPKGLYRRARAGQLKGMTGIDSPYEAPEQSDLVIDTTSTRVEDCVERLAGYVIAECGR